MEVCVSVSSLLPEATCDTWADCVSESGTSWGITLLSSIGAANMIRVSNQRKRIVTSRHIDTTILLTAAFQDDIRNNWCTKTIIVCQVRSLSHSNFQMFLRNMKYTTRRTVTMWSVSLKHSTSLMIVNHSLDEISSSMIWWANQPRNISSGSYLVKLWVYEGVPVYNWKS